MSRREQPNIISLRRCICLESITEFRNELEGRYDMFRKITAPDRLRADDLVIRLQNMQNDPCMAATQLRAIIKTKDQQVDKLTEDSVLPLVAKCIEFYGTNIIVRQLKTRYPQNNTIQNFRGWADCTAYAYQNNNGHWLQTHIDQIINANPNISTVWDTLILIYRQRNNVVHGSITQDDIQLLNNTLQYFQKYRTQYTKDYAKAVGILANALQTLPIDLFALPGQYDLANLLP